MVDQEVIDLPDDSGLGFDGAFFIPLQKIAGDTRQRTLNSIITGFQNPWLQDIDANGKNLNNVIQVTAEILRVEKTNTVIINTLNTDSGPTSILSQINTFGKNNLLYARLATTAQSNTPANESARSAYSIMSNGTRIQAYEVDGLNHQFMLLSGFMLHMGGSAIIDAGTLNTHTIPSGTADTLVLLLATQTLENNIS